MRVISSVTWTAHDQATVIQKFLSGRMNTVAASAPRLKSDSSGNFVCKNLISLREHWQASTTSVSQSLRLRVVRSPVVESIA